MISLGYKHNYDMLVAAVRNHDTALIECTDAVTGQPVMTVCIITQQDGMIVTLPVAKLFDGDPFKELTPPKGELHEALPLHS